MCDLHIFMPGKAHCCLGLFGKNVQSRVIAYTLSTTKHMYNNTYIHTYWIKSEREKERF